MASSLQSIVADIDAQMGDLRRDLTTLEEARKLLTNGVSGATEAAQPQSQSQPVTAPAKRRGRPPGRQGSRAQQALGLVQAHPGITIPDLAKHMKIEANYLYRVMPKLVESGAIVRDDTGYFPAPSSDVPAAA